MVHWTLNKKFKFKFKFNLSYTISGACAHDVGWLCTCRDALITSAVNCGTSFLAGFVVFSVLGYMAYEQHRDVTDVARQGSSSSDVTLLEF
jgi:SNF family Na+-dependent transporter